MENPLLKRLGYPQNTKLLINHADDLGLSHSQNKASIEAMEKGMINSGSIMVTCPWFTEIAKYAKEHEHLDLGIHITLTSEWECYKWGPVLPVNEVPTLVDEYGFFLGDESFPTFNLEEVEREVEAQINRAIAFGIKPTHLDSHMFCMYELPAFVDIYLKMSKKYNIPILLDKTYYTNYCSERNMEVDQENILVDKIHMAAPDNVKEGISKYYVKALKSLSPGLNVMLVHPAHNTMEMRGIIRGMDVWGVEWRQSDYEFFTSNLCKEVIEKEGVKMVTWRQLWEMYNCIESNVM